MMDLDNCRCGEKPDFKSAGRVFGHGDCPVVWWVECKCGLATKEIAEGYEGTDEDCKEKAANIWNGTDDSH